MTGKACKVSLIIPVFNGELFISDALNSALDQTLSDVEIIVVDDGSTDSTRDILRQYEGRVMYQFKSHGGQAVALNAGVRLSSGEYIAYLDADDVCLPERLEVQAGYLDIHSETALVYTDRYQIDKYGQVLDVIHSRQPDVFRLLQYNYIPRSSVMHRRRCLDEVGLFDEINTGNDDWDMWLRISEKFQLAYLPKPLIKYRVHGGNISSTRPNRLGYYRLTRLKMLESAYHRCGKPAWLRLMMVRARIEYGIGRISPLVGERSPRTWSRVDKVLDIFERVLVKRAVLGFHP